MFSVLFGERYNDSMAIEILLFSSDITLAKNIQSAGKMTAEPISVHPCTNLQRFSELNAKINFDFIFIDEAFATFDEASLPKESIVFLLSSPLENKDIQRKLAAGYTDLILKPVDISVLLHKMQAYSEKKKVLKEDLLFKMQVEGDVEITLRGKITQVSEFGAVINSDRLFAKNDVISFIPTMLFEYDGYDGEPSLARVLQSQPIPQRIDPLAPQHFETRIAFVAPNLKFMNAIRLWMRRQFVVSVRSGKEKSK